MSDDLIGPIGDKYGRHKKLLEEAKVVLDPSTFDWDAEIAKTPKERPRPEVWKRDEIRDHFGKPLYKGSLVLRFDTEKSRYIKAIVTDFDLKRQYCPVQILSEGKNNPGWSRPTNLLSAESLTESIL